MSNECIENMPADVYHQRRIGVASKSALDKLHPTPAHYLAWVTGDGDDEPTAAMTFGRAGHCAIFEPDVFARKYIAHPDFGDCRFKENKLARDAWRQENAERESLEPKEMATLLGVQKSIHSHELIRKLFARGKSELTFLWEDEETGLECKARADHYVGELATAVDLKLVADASPEGFAKSVAKYRYHVQEAHYSAGIRATGKPLKHFVFVAIEKAAPFASAIYSLDGPGKDRGHNLWRTDIETMARCKASGIWPGYAPGITTLSLPKWAA